MENHDTKYFLFGSQVVRAYMDSEDEYEVEAVMHVVNNNKYGLVNGRVFKWDQNADDVDGVIEESDKWTTYTEIEKEEYEQLKEIGL